MADYSDIEQVKRNILATTELKNKGFFMLDEVFKEHGWSLVKNEFDHIIYAKSSFDPNVFNIKLNKTSVNVTIPVKNSHCLYNTSFNDYFQASEYVEARLKDFINVDLII